MSNWQPMETAPKDGTEILAYHKGLGSAVIVQWGIIMERWVDRDRFWPRNSFTHWHPLPDPPTGTERVLQS